MAASVSTSPRPKDPARVAAGRVSIRKRWGPPRVLRLDHLDPVAADVIRAAWQAADNAASMKADPAAETPGSAQATEGQSDGTLPRSRRTAPGRVDRLHEAAIDAASEADRRWFLAHPGTGWRIRLPIAHEACLPHGRCLPERGYLIRCVELAPGVRVRVIVPAAEAKA